MTIVQTITPTEAPRAGLIASFAAKYGVEADKLLTTLKHTAFKQAPSKDGKAPAEITNEQMMALLVVAKEYNLNPFTKEIYAFPDDKRGAAMAYADTDGNVHGVVALRLGDQWHLWANADYHTKTKDFAGSVGLKFTW